MSNQYNRADSFSVTPTIRRLISLCVRANRLIYALNRTRNRHFQSASMARLRIAAARVSLDELLSVDLREDVCSHQDVKVIRADISNRFTGSISSSACRYLGLPIVRDGPREAWTNVVIRVRNTHLVLRVDVIDDVDVHLTLGIDHLMTISGPFRQHLCTTAGVSPDQLTNLLYPATTVGFWPGYDDTFQNYYEAPHDHIVLQNNDTAGATPEDTVHDDETPASAAEYSPASPQITDSEASTNSDESTSTEPRSFRRSFQRRVSIRSKQHQRSSAIPRIH